MTQDRPVTMLVTYYPKPGDEERILPLLLQHWPTLRRLGLVTEREATLWRGTDKRTSAEFFVEIFEWRNEAASDIAHQTPAVMAVWEPMGALLKDMTLVRLDAV